MKSVYQIIFLILGIVTAGCLWAYHFPEKSTLKIQTQTGTVEYTVELALTATEQRQGLMNRQNLPGQHGMLFLFRPSSVAHMWMKNTLIPLDMIFFDEKGIVTSVHYNATPLDTTIISSGQKVAGVLEINATEAEKYGIQKDSVIDLQSLTIGKEHVFEK